MVSFAKYLLEVSLCTAVVLLVYAVFLKGRTFFQLNRFYLIGGLVVSLIIPLISLPESAAHRSPALTKISLEKIETEYVPFSFHEQKATPAMNLTTAIAMIYACGVCFFTYRFLTGIRTVLRLKRRSVKTRIHDTDIYVQERFPAFSFFRIIFASARAQSFVIKHERVHVDQLHWLDNLLIEVFSILLWFNPVMIYYKRAVKNQHEFLADRGALGETGQLSAYLRCLLNTTQFQNGVTVTSHFGSNTIKNRIVMLTKNKTPLRHIMLYFLILPIMALLLVAFQDSPAVNQISERPQYVFAMQSVPTDAPIETGKVKRTFLFGEKFNPVTNKMQNHTGMDFVTDPGVNVMATADGIVIEAKFDEIKGNYVVIKHSDHFATQYFHMKAITVKVGVTVRKGEVIGFVGSTGLSVKDHLHYEVLKDGKAVDPVEYLPKELKEGC